MSATENKITAVNKPHGSLFDILGYDTIEEYEDFIKRINNNSNPDLLLVAISALRYAQSRGVFKKLEESETVSITVRKLTEMLSQKQSKHV